MNERRATVNDSPISKNHTPLISVIMAVYNESSALVTSSVESILTQTFGDFEYIIVLDDPSNTKAQTLLNEYAQKDARVRLLINDKNEGLTYSLNRALKSANGTYIARMDADDISLPNRFETQKTFLEQNNLDFVGSFVQTIDDEGTIISPCVKVPQTNRAIQKTLKVNNCIFHPTWLLKKCVFDTVGEYRGRYIEDYDFVLRARENGFTFGNVGEVLLQYRMSTKSISRSNAFTQYLYMRYVQKLYFGRGAARKNGHAESARSVDSVRSSPDRTAQNTERAEAFVAKRYSVKKAHNYARASNYLTAALSFLHNKKFLCAAFFLLKSCVTSRAFLGKIMRYALQSL